MANIMNYTSFNFEDTKPRKGKRDRDETYARNVIVAKTEVTNDKGSLKCIIHKANHSINEC